jgi:uncharacterized protein (DUF2141 family)
VEGRSTPFIGQLTPEWTGRVTADNRNLVGNAFAYLSRNGKFAFHLRIIVIAEIDPTTVSKVQLYNVEDEELVGEKFTYVKASGFYTYNKRINYALGESINVEKIAVNIYTKAIGTGRPAISGLLVNNATTFISWLQADQEVDTPSGTSANDGFATAIVYPATPNDQVNYKISVVVNHDLTQTVSAIHLHTPAASNTNGAIVVSIPEIKLKGGKVIGFDINATTLNYLQNHLGYINIHTTRNTGGAIRGQLLPFTAPRYRLPVFPNTATQTTKGITITTLPDGGLIEGNLASLRSGGARNKTGQTNDDRVCVFQNNFTSGAFDNLFRFELPVTIDNKFALRAANFYFSYAGDVADTGKFNLGFLNLNTQVNKVIFPSLPHTGKSNYENLLITVDGSDFADFLGPGGLFVNLQASSLSGAGLNVDKFFMVYYVVDAYANNVLKAVIARSSTVD